MARLTAAVVLLASTASLVAPVSGFETFVALLPNGNGVSGVKALGHVNVAGDGALNAFGEDFEHMGESWTTELCEADSDSDGQTNGQELGDPCCEWNAQTASTPRWTSGVSHPGDATSKSDEALFASVKCSNATDSSMSSSSSGSAGVLMSTSSTSSASMGATISTAAGFISLILALVG